MKDLSHPQLLFKICEVERWNDTLTRCCLRIFKITVWWWNWNSLNVRTSCVVDALVPSICHVDRVRTLLGSVRRDTLWGGLGEGGGRLMKMIIHLRWDRGWWGCDLVHGRTRICLCLYHCSMRSIDTSLTYRVRLKFEGLRVVKRDSFACSSWRRINELEWFLLTYKRDWFSLRNIPLVRSRSGVGLLAWLSLPEVRRCT